MAPEKKTTSTPKATPRRSGSKRKAEDATTGNDLTPDTTKEAKQPPSKKRKLAAKAENVPTEDSADIADAAVDSYHASDGVTEAKDPPSKKRKAPTKSRSRSNVKGKPDEAAVDSYTSTEKAKEDEKAPSKKRKLGVESENSTHENCKLKAGEVAIDTTYPSPESVEETKQQPLKKRKVSDATESRPDMAEADGNAFSAVNGTTEVKVPPPKKRKIVTKSKRTAIKTEVSLSENIESEEEAGEQPARKMRKATAIDTEQETPKPTRKSPRQRKPTKKELEAKRKLAPPPLPPAKINKVVAAKVRQVQNFVDNIDEEKTQLQRDPTNQNLISIPESALLTAIMNMRLQYETGPLHEASVSEVEEAITKRFKQDIGETKDIDWVTIDALKATAFEGAIHEKIARHGLDEINLLEIELEISKREQLKQAGLGDPDEEIAWTADRFISTFEEIWERVNVDKAEDEKEIMEEHADDEEKVAVVESSIIGDEKEIGRQGACLAPIQVV